MKEITKDSIRELPLLQFEGNIIVIDSLKQVTKATQKLSDETILGFDTEKKPTFKKGEYNHPSLIQLATDHEVYIFQLTKIGFHPGLMKILEDRTIMKLGVSIRDDLKELDTLSPFSPDGFQDLGIMAKEREIPYHGLRNLAAFFLNGRISKSQQTSNWENTELTTSQQIYAATDAWVALRIYEEMMSLA